MRYVFALLVALALAGPAKAAPIFFDLALVSGGTVVGSGSISIEGDEFAGTGLEFFYPAGSVSQPAPPTPPNTLLSFVVTISGVTFAMEDDFDFPDRPLVSFEDGKLVFVDYAGINSGGYSLDVGDILFEFYAANLATFVSGTVAVTRRDDPVVGVAEPGTLLLLGAGLLVMGAAVRRRRPGASVN